MSFSYPFTAVTGAVFSAAQWNTSGRDNIAALWVGTTAGDMEYYVSSIAKSRLAKGTASQVLRMNSGATAPEWSSILTGAVHTKGTAFTNTITNTTSTSYTTIGAGALRVDLVLTATCTIYAFAFGTAYTNNGLQDGFFIFQINSVTDANGDNVRVKHNANTPFSAMSRATGITAGTRRVELLWKIAAGDQINLQSCVLYVIAVAE